MLGGERIAGTVVWCCLVGINWIQAQFVHPVAEWWLESVLGTWEESVKSLIREVFAQVIRIADSILNALFTWFPGYQSAKTTFQKPSAWQSWWAENRQSTFNAIIDRAENPHEGLQPDVKPSNGPAGHAETHHALSTPRSGLRWLFGRGADTKVADPETSSSKKRKMNAQGKTGSSKQQKERIPAHKKLKRNGSKLFDRPAGWAVQERAKRGFLEDLRIGAELATTVVFDAVRGLIRKVLFMPEKQIFSPLGFDGRATGWVDDNKGDDSPERPLGGPGLRRTNSFSDWESLHNVWTAAEVIKAAGYPLEQHTVTTSDGYILRMERLPRHGGRDVVFFMHGILDTSMGWVSNGVTGSQAFAAFDQGFDVWLGNSRANPPRVHESPEMMGAAYWHFTVNQLGEEDIAAQVDFIHMTKCNELNEASSHNTSHTLKKRRHHYRVRKSHSDTALSGLERDSADEPSALAALKADGQHGASSKQAVNPRTGLAEQPEAAAAPQVGTGAQPRRRYGLLGLMKRNKSEIGTHSLVPTIFKRFHTHAQQEVHPQPIAENGIEDDDHDDLFASPRSQLDASSPEIVVHAHQSPSCQLETPSTDIPSQDNQQAPDQQPLLHQQPALPKSPFAASVDQSPAPHGHVGTPPMAIPMAHLQPNLSSSAPTESQSHMHQWAAKRGKAGQDPPREQVHQTRASHGDQADQNGDAETGRGTRAAPSLAPRLSALHGSRSRSRGNLRSDSRQNIRWNDSSESLAWSSQEDLAQLVPDRASADGVERPPQQGFSVDSVGRHGTNGFAASFALPTGGGGAVRPQESMRQEHDDGDLVAAEQDKVSGDHGSQRSSHRGSHTGHQQGSGAQQEPYRLRAVGHSLGGASLLIYAVTRSMRGKPTHLSRLILLTPAGFQQNYPKAAAPFLWVLPPLVWALHWIRPGVGAACYIPSSLLRYVTFKLTVDMQQIPALNELVRAGIRVLLNGDSSQWDRAMQMPHYNTRSMPSISFHTGMHLIQWIRSGRFQMFKYRNKKSNQAVYGSDEPTDIAENYSFLRMPVDIMAGRSDGVIAKENVLMHYQKLQEANCSVTYKEFDFGHLDFTFAVKDDLRHYVLSRLLMDS